MKRGVITQSQRTWLGAIGELVVCGIIAGGVAFLVLLAIAFLGGLQVIEEVSR